MISAAVIEDSVSNAGIRLTTFQLQFPRFILPEFNTHRMLSRNASSSRAIPVSKLIEEARNNPAIPTEFGKNKPGMQSAGPHDHLVKWKEMGMFGFYTAEEFWRKSAMIAADRAEAMSEAGYHKQVVNRLLEPFIHAHVVVTGTEWSNFFALRNHEDAQPDIRELAIAMQDALNKSHPSFCEEYDLHVPYVSSLERRELTKEGQTLVSAARCARVSYKTHDGQNPSIEKDIALAEKLISSGHMSPLEHQAWPMYRRQVEMDHCKEQCWSGNFYGWTQFRKTIPNESR